MPWRRVNVTGGNRVVSVSYTFPSLASAALSGVPIVEWPFVEPGVLVGIQFGADAISVAAAVNARFRKTDVSVPSTAFLVNAAKAWAADNHTLVDSTDANTVTDSERFDQGDRILMDKDAGGSITRGVAHFFFAMG